MAWQDEPGDLIELEPGQGAREDRTSRTIGRISETIVRGWRRRRPSESWSASSSLGVVRRRRAAATRRRDVDGVTDRGVRRLQRRSSVGVGRWRRRRGRSSARRPPLTGRCRRARSRDGRIRPLPRARWTSLATGVRAGRIGRPAGIARPSAAPPAGPPASRVAVEGRVGDADLERAVGVGHGHARAGRGPARTRRPARCRARPRSARCASRPSRPVRPAAPSGPRAGASRGSGRTGGDADEAALVAGRRDRLGGRQARAGSPARGTGRSGRRRRVLTSSPTMSVRPGAGRPPVARPSAPSIRSWSVIARWVRPRAGRRPDDATRAGQRVERRARVWQCRSKNARAAPPVPPRAVRSAGPATS